MAAKMSAILVQTALAVLGFVALGIVSLLVPSVTAQEDNLLSHEWYFTITVEVDEPHPFVPPATAIECIASVVESSGGVRIPMSCNQDGYVEFAGEIDKSASTVRLAGELAGLQIESEGTLQVGERVCVETEWRLMPQDTGVHGTIHGCQELGGRGLVRCPPLQIGVLPSIPMGSKDARLILQAEAGLPLHQEAGCWFRGDVNVDGSIDTRDALLILQFEAGLFEHFPP